MARCIQVSKKVLGRALLTAVFAFLLLTSTVSAAPAAPVLLETPWMTGEIQTCYSGIVPGNTIILYTMTIANPNQYMATDTWSEPNSAGCHVTRPFQNGQTVWHYIVQVDPNTGEISPQSNLGKQTPPITAYIINWPDMLKDLQNALSNLGQSINDHLDKLETPSDQAINDLKNAIDGLKNAVGAGQAQTVGNNVVNGIQQAQQGMKPPIVKDDGNGTYTGGSGGLKLPNTTSTNSLGLQVPNVDEGTDTELTMRIPYMVDMQGNLVYMKLFTKEQMDKMKWLGLLRDLATAAIWIMFAFWLVQRFSPAMKV